MSESFWMGGRLPRGAALTKDLSADVCVVGGGWTGLSAAYLLARAGKSVVLLESRRLAAGESARTTAHLSTALDETYSGLESLLGGDASHLAAVSHAAAISRVEELIKEERIACGFSRLNGYLFAAPDAEVTALDEELEACRRAGLDSVRRLAQGPLPFWGDGPCLEFPRQAQLDPARYLAGLAAAARRRGAQLFTGARVVEVEGALPAFVRTAEDGPVVRCEAVVVATHAPVNDRLALSTRLAPYRTYVVAGRVPAGAVPKGLYWDMEDPYHYVRLARRGGAEVLLVGGEDHKTGQADDAEERYERLEAWARRRFPRISSFTHRWSGQVHEPVDGAAYIGRHPTEPSNVYVATGLSGGGTTQGMIAGLLVTDLILGVPNPWASLYDPSRVTLGALPRFSKENLNAGLQYLRYALPGDAAGVVDIAPGSGAVITRGLEKIAVYRAPDGALIESSAVCPHLGGVVSWNSEEKTWDCPVHGSRFLPDGGVVAGPALCPLAGSHHRHKDFTGRPSQERPSGGYNVVP